MNARRFAFTIALLALATAFTYAADEKKPSPTGTWKWTTQTQDGQSRTSTLKLKLDGDKLTGAMVRRDGSETPIESASFKDNQLAFSVTMEFNGNKFTRKFSGKLDANTIKGKIESERDGQTQSRDWEAKRDTAASATGTWKWTRTFNNNEMTFVLKLKQDGEKLTGTMAVGDRGDTAIEDGKITGSDLSFTVTRERDGNKFVSKYTGKVDGDTIKGKVNANFGGQDREFDWDATRSKD